MPELRDKLNSIFLCIPYKSFFAARRTDSTRITSLINTLAPVNTDKELIRIGPDSDGGYLVPDDLEGITTCFSPGVSDVSGFELDCASRGMDIFMADASVEKSPDSHEKFNFIKKYLGAFTHGDVITMQQWVDLVTPNPSGDWMMQMDIEGSEYEVLLNIPDYILQKFRIIVIEFHKLDYLFDDSFFQIANCAFLKLLNTHTCLHIHPNNSVPVTTSKGVVVPQMLEMTFLRNDRIETRSPATLFPHPLDCESVPSFPSVTLPKSWYGV